MDVGGEKSQNGVRNQASWAPMTPLKPNLAGNMAFPSSISSPTTSVGDENSTNWGSVNNVGMPKKAYYQTMSRWNGFTCQELLFQAEAGAIIPPATDGPDPNYHIPVPDHHSYDLNLMPEAAFSVSHGKSIPKFAPVTPNKSMRVDKSDVDTRDLQTEKQKNETTASMQIISKLNNDQESPRTATESSRTVDSTELQEIQNPDKGDGQVIDLNKTPQQKPRRKKHRPKVITEGKPRTPKPKTPNPADSKKSLTGKRKYVRKNRNEILSDTPPEVAGQHGASRTRAPMKRSCRRTLNFEETQPEAEDPIFTSFKVNSELQVPHFCTSRVSESTIQVCSRIEENTTRNRQTEMTHHESTVQGILDRNTPPWPTIPNDSNCSTSVNLMGGQEQAKVFVRNYHHALKQADTGSINMNGVCSNSLLEYLSWANSRKRIDKGQNNTTSSAIFCRAAKDFEGEIKAEDCKVSSASGQDCKVSSASGQAGKGLPDNQQINEYIIMALSSNERPTRKRSRSARNTAKAPKWASLTRIAMHEMGIPYPDKLGDVDNNGSETNKCIHALIAQTNGKLAKRSRTKKINHPAVQNPKLYSDQQSYSRLSEASRTIFSVDAINRQLKCLDINRESRISYQERNASAPFNGYQEQNALILYRTEGTVVPFAGSFDPIKKPRARPKVDLDEETNRVWKLLLENINSEGIDGTDEDKAKWWEEERNVFRGRADSFIARMHLVQGDRRFSQWKGSVLDSVVGVFLTQNVSDHLSSSAFMSLAARFPLKSRNHDKACAVSNEPEVCISEITPNQPVCDRTSFTPLDTDLNEITGASECCMEQDGKATGLVSLQNSVDSTSSQSCDKLGSCSGSNSDTEDLPNRSIHHCCLHKDESSTLLEAYQGNAQMPCNEGLKDDCNDFDATKHDNGRQNIDEASPKSYMESSMDPSSNNCLHEATNAHVLIVGSFELFREETQSSDISQIKNENSASNQSTLTVESASQNVIQDKMTVTWKEAARLCNNIQVDRNIHIGSQNSHIENQDNFKALTHEKNDGIQQNLPNHSDKNQAVIKKITESGFDYSGHSLSKECSEMDDATAKSKGKRVRKEKKDWDWDELRKQAEANGRRERTANTMDSLDWEAVRRARVDEIADTIKERGMNNRLAERIKDFLDRMVREHGNIDLEWLRDVPPDEAKEYLLSIKGLGLKSVECVRLLTLHHLAFPVDTNVGRIAVRLGWVPLQPLPESLQLHLLELYPVLESIQKYLWPRLCKLDQRTLYELHYQMITFGKVFCTKSKPNCNACPMRGECRHFASAFASARLALPGPEEKCVVVATEKGKEYINFTSINEKTPLPLPHATKQSEEEQSLEARCQSEAIAGTIYCEPIIEEPATPEPECTTTLEDIEDALCEDPDEIPTIKLNIEEFTQNLQNYMQRNMELQDGDMSKALVALGPESASIPTPKLKNVSRLRTEHHVYELPDSHPLLEMLQLDKREPDDPSPYLLAIWTPGETPESIEPPERRCCSQGLDKLCDEEGCFSCNSVREANSQTVRGTVLIPCRTAMRGSFPLNGTYFQVNEMFADHDSSLKPIDVPRAWLWNLPRRTVYFGTSIPTIFRGLTTQGIQQCFWRGYVCVRGFDQKTRAPRPLIARLHFPASKVKRTRDPRNDE